VMPSLQVPTVLEFTVVGLWLFGERRRRRLFRGLARGRGSVASRLICIEYL